ncbi:asparagine synthase (glutamine-hydrolyzing) [Amylibacter sp.]|nr:asparagine synthase (glutamine-hydrolyzing) [Amylibacter sp.]
MCSISGIITNSKKIHVGDIVSQLNKTLGHRGPDGSDTHSISFQRQFECCLGMTRLAIRGGIYMNQPMKSKDGNKILVFNGEIFNCENLSKKYLQKELKYNYSDTEVLFDLLCKVGIGIVKELKGMFSFSFVERNKNTLYLVRDTLGFKPLYMSKVHGGYMFSSETFGLKNIINTQINSNAIIDYLYYGYVNYLNPLYKDIEEVKPGYIYEIRDGNLRKEKYEYVPEQNNRNFSEIIDDSILDWLSSDTKIALGLSGGIDSNLILLSALHNGAKDKIQPFTVSFPWMMDNQDEVTFSKQICKDFNIEHEILIIDENEIFDGWLDTINALDEPFSGGISSFWLYKNIKNKGFRVCITGAGGDELFGNYGLSYHYSKLGRMKRYKNYLKMGGSIKAIFNYPMGTLHAPIFSPNNNIVINGLPKYHKYSAEKISDSLWEKNSGTLQNLKTQTFSLQLPNEFLKMTDRLSMTSSVEARTPLLDQDIVYFMVNNITNNEILFEDKTILLNKIKDYQPNYSPLKKLGFPTPQEKIMQKFKDRYSFKDIKKMQNTLADRIGFEIKINNFADRWDTGENANSSDWNYVNLLMWSSSLK